MLFGARSKFVKETGVTLTLAKTIKTAYTMTN